ncbi:MAG: class II glutamine amidotransferase [Reyranella sp.]|uniref:class II glutamine amidotransferase n=1 Tax=Reyranella sp. TaxID=1929291 RepID=UPI0027318A6E|nr:class II glutamine amidotransferase [Reyranella sp.]MDP1967292.1 class II glutamine amidotransferase [Reyranella sp.]MDP2372174.1 class II glutamine amidotransferase [Reyranella sp.]
MCELFCLSARLPAQATFSLKHFAAHGAPNGRNIDGWGVGFHDGRDVRLYKEPEPAEDSPWMVFIEERALSTKLLISHIRRATMGANSHANSQPFMRELGGRMHLFAHNGGFDTIASKFAASGHRFHPVGETDSEMAFCLLLHRLAPLWEGAAPPLAARHAAFEAFAAEMRPLGIANFLYSDGDFVFGHGHRRTQADAIVAPPGLWCRHRHRAGTPAPPGVAITAGAGDGDQEITLLASVPVTEGDWRPLGEGEIVVVAAGELVTSGLR